jgi:tetratricopeptide (TPR) repeat protein
LKRVPLAAGLCAFVVYVWWAAPGLYWSDSQELGAAAVRLGVAHPTGFPIFVLAGRALAWIPFGELAFRVHLGSALAAAVAVGAVTRLVLDLAGGDVIAALGAAAAALVLGGGMTFFRQATVTEVYAGAAAGLALALGPTLRVAAGAGAEVGLPLAFGAGLAATGLHASFRLLLALPLCGLYLWRLARGARWPVAAPALVVLGAAGVALYLPVRSASGRIGALDWGHPRTAVALVEHLDAARIRTAFKAKMFAATAGPARAVADRTDADLGTLALVAAAGGALALAARRRSALALLAVVALGDAAYAIWINPMGIADRQTGVPLALALAALAGVGVAAGGRALGRAGPYAAAALAVLVAVQPVVAGASAKAAGRGTEAPRAWAEAALASAPPDAVVFAQSDTLAATLFWLTLAEPVRPDVAALVRQHAWDVARTAAVLRVPAAAAGVAGIVRQVAGRPILWEPGDDEPPLPVAVGVPVGGTAIPLALQIARVERAFAPPATDDEDGAATAARAYRILGAGGDLPRAQVLSARAVDLAEDPIARLNLARYRLALHDDARARSDAEASVRALPRRADAWSLLGVIDARAGRCAEAQVHLGRALALDPTDRDALTNLPRLASCRPK